MMRIGQALQWNVEVTHKARLLVPSLPLSRHLILVDRLIHITYPASTLEPLLKMNNTSLMDDTTVSTGQHNGANGDSTYIIPCAGTLCWWKKFFFFFSAHTKTNSFLHFRTFRSTSSCILQSTLERYFGRFPFIYYLSFVLFPDLCTFKMMWWRDLDEQGFY